MRFADLEPGSLARVPKAYAPRPGDPLPPAVRMDHKPTPCGANWCEALNVVARDLETGATHYYHRKPDFQVIEITPAEESL
ncbi:hypothetical protein ACFXJ8_12060 [Nonomuraea sp. NPDC059194]|uniref:hypothetical protein n=1 Tax=Nonomuraea sp. NPDC059194 TaxID=3346764 RepID=UPI00369DA5F6